MKIIVFNLHTFLLFVYHQYSVPTILQGDTPISFWKKVILYRLQGEGLLSTPSPRLFFQFLTRKSTIRFSRNFTLFVIIAKHLQHYINISFFFHTDFTIYNF